MIRASLLILSVYSPLLLAEAEHKVFQPLSYVNMTQWILGLLIVLLAIFVFGWVLRRLGSFSSLALDAGRFRVLAAISLGARDRLVLVQAGQKQLILGVSPGRVNMLCTLEGEDAIVLKNEGVKDSFAEKLETLLIRKTS